MGRFVGLLTGVLAILVLGIVRWSPGSPAGDGAREVLAEIVGDGRPRVPGSEAIERARQVAEKRLAASGFRTERQRGFTCNAMALCGFVENVVAVRAGTEALGPVLVMAHLDSVQAGPGAGDDAIGVAAVLEAARGLGSEAALARPVVVVLTDGEEVGLLGATLFAETHPLARDVAAVVNVDARGNAGPSLLFEVSGGAHVVRLASARLTRPFTSSLFAEIYRRMPNDTDYSLFRARAPGVNFANVGGIARYHTPLDTASAVDPGTLRHHGAQVLAMARAFGEARAAITPEPEVVWFDVLAFGVVRLPSVAMLPLALLALGLVVAAFRREARALAPLRAALALASALGSALLVGLALHATGVLPTPWVAHPGAALALFHVVALGALVAIAPRADAGGAWTLFALLGVVLAAVAPGASHLLVLPALLTGLLGLATSPARAAPLGAQVLALAWLPLAAPLYETVGLLAPADVLPAVVVALALAPFLPDALRARLVRPALVAAAVLALVAALVPRFSADHPQRVNVVVRQEDEGPAWVAASAAWGPRAWGAVPAPMAAARGAPERDVVPIPGWPAAAAHAAPRAPLVAPEVVRAPGDPSRVHVRSRRGARDFLLETSEPIVVEGRAVVPVSGRVVVRGVPAIGLDLRARGDLVVADVSPGVAGVPLAEAVVRARPPEATPSQDGDLTIVATKLAR